jgi:surface antigen
MKKFISIILLLSLIGTLSIGCATKQEAGMLTGAAVGAAVGSTVGHGSGRNFAIFLGSIVGANIGATVGQYMDEQDRLRTAAILESNRTDQSSSWQNPDTGYQYTVTPTKTVETAEGPCREFTIDTAKVGGKTEQVYGTACRQPDGSWKIVK